MLALFLHALLALLLHHPTAAPATVPPLAPARIDVPRPASEGAERVPAPAPALGRVAPPLPSASSLDNSAQNRPGENGGTVPAPVSGPGTDAPGPDSPVCEPGQTPAADGCAQGQLPDETNGRQYG